MKRVRSLVGYFHSSTQASEKLHEIQQKHESMQGKTPVKLKQDVVTRWWSTYSMLESLFTLRECLEAYAQTWSFPKPKVNRKTGKQSFPIGLPTAEQWSILESLMKLLEPLSFAQKTLEGQKHVSSSLVLGMLVSIRRMFGGLQVSPSVSSLHTVIESMIKKFDEVFGDMNKPFHPTVERGKKDRQVRIHPVFIKAHALDPRFKKLRLISDLDNRNAVWNALLADMVALGPASGEGNRGSAVATAEETAESPQDQPMSPHSKAMAMMFSHAQPQGTSDDIPGSSGQRVQTWEEQCSTELENYKVLSELNLMAHNDPLEWWRTHHKHYPILWRLAKVYLAVPATSAASERAFSVTGNIITALRTRLDPQRAQDIQFLHDNKEFLARENLLYH